MAKNRNLGNTKQTTITNKSRYSYLILAGSFTVALLATIYQYMRIENQTGLQTTDGLKMLPTDTTQQVLTTLASEKIETPLPMATLKENMVNEENLSTCNIKLQALKKNASFSKWLKKSHPIKVDQRVVGDKKLIETAQKNCKQAFIEILEENSFFPNLLSKNNLEIMIIPPSVARGNRSYGIYSIKSNMIGIIYNPDLSVQEYKQALRNEFFSQQIVERNTLNGVNTSDLTRMSLPFVKRNGEIHEELFKKFEITMIQAKETIKKYSKLFTKKTIKHTEELDTLLSMTNHYFPKKYADISEEDFKLSIDHHLITPPDSNGYFTSGEKHPAHLPQYYGQKKNHVITYTYCKDDAPESKAIALLNDLNTQLSALENPNGPYAKKEKTQKLAELGSFIAELPSDIQQFLFPDFYQYMCEFFTSETPKLPHHNRNEDTQSASKEQTSNFFKPTTGRGQEASKQKHTTAPRPYR